MNIDKFTQAYIEAALLDYEELWDSTEECGHSEHNYSFDDIDKASLKVIIDDCANFQRNCEQYIDEKYYLDPLSCSVEEQAGHDFWFTRNGAGVGFWEPEWDEPANSNLDQAAKQSGPMELYLQNGTINVLNSSIQQTSILPNDTQIMDFIIEKCHNDSLMFNGKWHNTIDNVTLCVLLLCETEDNGYDGYDGYDIVSYDYYYIDGKWIEWKSGKDKIRQFVDKINNNIDTK